MVRAVLGTHAPAWECLEAVAAETQAALGPVPDEAEAGGATHDHDEAGACTADDASRQRRRERSRAARLRSRRQARKAARAARRELAVLPLLRLPALEAAISPHAIHDVLVEIVRLRRCVEWERARLLYWMDIHVLHAGLGHPSITHYAEHRLGMAPRDVTEALDRHRRLGR
jgi:hypothetical protein